MTTAHSPLMSSRPSYWGMIARHVRRHRVGALGLSLAIGVVVAAIGAPLLASDKALLRADGAAGAVWWSPWAVSLLDLGCYSEPLDRLFNCLLIAVGVYALLLPLVFFLRAVVWPQANGFWLGLVGMWLLTGLALFAVTNLRAFQYYRTAGYYEPSAAAAGANGMADIGTDGAAGTAGTVGATAARGARAASPVLLTTLVPFSAKPGEAGTPLIHAPNLPPVSAAKNGGVHWLGTTRDGVDVLAQLIHGTRTAVTVAVLGVALAAAAGLFLGLVAGATRGVWAVLAEWLLDAFFYVPALLLAVAVLAIIPDKRVSLGWAVGAVALSLFAYIGRFVKREVARDVERDYPTAARALGLSAWRVVLTHVLPAGLAPLAIAGCFAFGMAVMLETALTFFQLAPTPQSWGELLRVAYDRGEPVALVGVGVALTAVMLAANLVGEALLAAYRTTQGPVRM